MAEIDLLQAIQTTLRAEMERDETIVLLGEDVARAGGSFRACDGLYERFGSGRVLDGPMAEAGVIGTAVGMALHGLRPVVELSAPDFLWQGLDQLLDASRMRYRSAAAYRVPLVVRLPYGVGIGAGMDQSASPEGWLASVPGLTVLCPADAGDAAGLLRSAIRAEDPVVFLEPRRLYRHERSEVGEEPVEIGRARIRRQGSDVTLVVWGPTVPAADAAADAASERGIQTEIVDLRTLRPLDIETLLGSVAKTGRVVVAGEGPRTGGYGAELAATVAERAILHLEAPVVRVGAPDAPVSQAHEDIYLPDPSRIAAALDRVANF